MTPIVIIFILLVAMAVGYFIYRYVDPPFRTILLVAIGLALVYWLLTLLGLAPSLHKPLNT